MSRKTYQATLLALGIRDDPATSSRLSHSAEQGWLRSYILYCENVPCAFMLGFQYGGCYYYDDVGYDPAYAKWSVGSVLQLKVIEDILDSPHPLKHFDFRPGSARIRGASETWTGAKLTYLFCRQRREIVCWRLRTGVRRDFQMVLSGPWTVWD